MFLKIGTKHLIDFFLSFFLLFCDVASNELVLLFIYFYFYEIIMNWGVTCLDLDKVKDYLFGTFFWGLPQVNCLLCLIQFLRCKKILCHGDIEKKFP